MAEQLWAGETHALATITRLVIAADGDTLYREVYLRRALELMAPIVSEASWAAALTRATSSSPGSCHRRKRRSRVGTGRRCARSARAPRRSSVPSGRSND